MTAMSAALSFRTIFAMIPALVLAVLVLKSLGALEDGKQSLRAFLDRSGFSQIAVVGEAAEGASPVEIEQLEDAKSARVVNLADEIIRTVTEVEEKLTPERIGPVGAALFIWTALTMLTTLERSLNRIFSAPRNRSLGRRVLLYWSALTLGPLVLVLAMYMGRRLTAYIEVAPGASWILGLSSWAGPMALGIIVVSGLYKLMPNTRIAYKAALGGAFVAVPLWMIAKWAFSIYVANFVRTGNLYGALGLLPLFMIWLNLSWLILLFGAELANAAANMSTFQAAERISDEPPGPSELLAAGIAVARGYVAGQGPVQLKVVAEALNTTNEHAELVLERLGKAQIVSQVNGRDRGGYLLTRPPDHIQLSEILGIAPGAASRKHPAADNGASIERTVEQTWDRVRTSMSKLTLQDALE